MSGWGDPTSDPLGDLRDSLQPALESGNPMIAMDANRVMGELGVVRDAKLTTTNSYTVYREIENPTAMVKLACWINEWLPFGLRLGEKNGRWWFFRP